MDAPRIVDGKPFWARLMNIEVCPLSDCCRNQKQLEHCGLGKDLPCKMFLELRNSNMDDDEFEKSLDFRQKT